MTDNKITVAGMERRDFLVTAGAGVVALMAAALVPGRAFAKPEDAEKLIAEYTGGKSVSEGRVTLQLPQIAENGNTVPVTVEVDSPMSANDFVKKIHIISEGNPTPYVATFNLTPMTGKAEVSARMRMARTQNVVALAEMSDGSFYAAKQQIKVTIGGCGG